MKMNEAPIRDPLKEQELAAYLAAHPDFFQAHEHLLPALQLPHPESGKAISLLERQVALLREQKLELKQKLQQLTQVARRNERLLDQLQRLILDLIAAADLAGALRLLEGALRQEFQADAVAIWLFQPVAPETARFIPPGDPDLLPFQSIIDERRPLCGRLRPEQALPLFGEGAAIGSAAIIPLCEGEGSDCVGLVAIASADPGRYHPEMGTVFLRHLGAVAARTIRSRLN